MTENITVLKQPIRLLIIDDHQMVRDGLKVMVRSLQQQLPCETAEAEGASAAIKLLAKKDFDLVLVDYQMPEINGAETIYRILRSKPEMKIIMLSNYDELAYVQSGIDAGAKGYILKNIEPAEMLKALRTVMAGRMYYSSEVAIKLIEHNEDKSNRDARIKTLLTKRETEVLKLIAMEFTNEEIAQQLFVAKRTIDTHRQNLIIKLDVRNTVGLVKAAMRLRLFEE